MTAVMDLFAAHGPVVFGLAVGIPVAARVVVALLAIRGANAKDRPEILRAVGDMFRPWRRGGR